MKKLLIALIALTSLIGLNSNSAYAQHPDDVRFTLGKYAFGSKIYPTIALWNANNRWANDIFFYFNLIPPRDGAVVRIKIEESPLNYETIIQETASKGGQWLSIDPLIKWKLDKFPEITQAINFTLTAVLEIDGVEIDRINEGVQCRPINEIVFGYYNSKNEWIDTRDLYASFVNEDYEGIDPILQEILAGGRDRNFVGYQQGVQKVYDQIYWIWEYLAKLGSRYSSIGTTSNVQSRVSVQTVRFIDQVLNNTQANCVDGSVMMASFFRKIGLNAYIVFTSEPHHCMVGVGIPNGDGTESVMYIESTLIGYYDDPYTSYKAATQSAYKTITTTPSYKLVNIENARARGIVPIPRYMSND